MGLLTKDILTTKGNPININKLSQIFKKNLNEGFTYTLLILDENKKVIKSYGQIKDIETWQASKPIGIGLKPIRFCSSKGGYNSIFLHQKFYRNTCGHHFVSSHHRLLRRIPDDYHQK